MKMIAVTLSPSSNNKYKKNLVSISKTERRTTWKKTAEPRNKNKIIHQGRQLLQERLSYLKLGSYIVSGDGNCQFRSFSFELYGDDKYHMDVRATIVKWMELHEGDFAPFVGDSIEFQVYVKKMKRSRTWGDELTIRAFCDAYKAVTHVITTEKENYHLKYKPDDFDEENGRHCFLSYISPVHYNVVCLP